MIDKMFLMLPSFRKVVNENNKKKLANKMFINLKGSTALETLANIKKEASKYDIDLTDVQTLDLSKNIKVTSEEINQEIKTLHETFINRLFDNTDNQDINDLLRTNNISPQRLTYETREGTDGYYSNKLIETYQHILAEPEIIKEVMQSIDSSFFKSTINALVNKNKSSSMSLYHMEPKNEIETVYSFRAGKAGVGIEANSMVDINRRGQLYIKKNTTKLLDYLSHEFNIEYGQILLDQEYSRPLEDREVLEFASKVGIKDIDTFVSELKDVKTVSSMVAILNGFVDIAKDPYITQGGWDTASTNFGNTLLRMGVNPLKVITLMMQPAIKAKFTKGNQATFELIKEAVIKELPDESKSLININDIVDLYDFLRINNYDEIDKIVSSARAGSIIPNSKLLNLNDLTESAKRFNIKDLHQQIEILAFADLISDINKEIKLNIEVSRTDTDGLNGDVANMYVTNNKIEKLKNSEILGGIESKFKNSPLAVFKDNLSKVFDMAQNNPHLFPEVSKMNLAVVDYISDILLNSNVESNEVLKEINDTLYAVKMQQFFKLNYNESMSLLKDFPNEFNKFKDEHKEDYLILKELSVKSVVSKNLNNVNGLINLNARERTGIEKAKISNSWNKMLKDHPTIAEKLIKYSYVSTNFNFSTTQFYELVPTSYYIDNNITKFIKEYDNRNIDLINVINHLVKSSIETSKLVPYVGKSNFKTFKGLPYVNVERLTTEGIGVIKSSNNSVLIFNNDSDLIIKDNDDNSFVPVHSINQLDASIDGNSISLFQPFVPSNQGVANVIQELLNSKASISSRGLSLTNSDLNTNIDSEIVDVYANISDNFKNINEKKQLIESYRDKLNRKMTAGQANMLIDQLLFSDLSIAEIEQELKNCI